jgi:hypothetical protein
LQLPPPQYAMLLESERSVDPTHAQMIMRHVGIIKTGRTK